MWKPKDPSDNKSEDVDRRENDVVAGSGNAFYAEEEGGYAGPSDPSIKPHPRQEGQATIRNNPDFEKEMSQSESSNSRIGLDVGEDELPDVTPAGP